MFAYDDFNRLICSNLATNGTCASPTSGTATYTYDYDRYGNRWHQNGPWSMQLSFSGNNNRMDSHSYDSAGNLLNDGSHSYFYDAENRLIQVDGTLGTCSSATACYVYNAAGRRVRKTTGSTSVDYLYDLAGQEITELTSAGAWNRGEVYAGGRHLATYNGGTTNLIHADWLGTERVRTTAAGASCENITSLPFGDGQSISGSCGDASPMHFTGKERDSESNLDYFGARYYSSSMGRWMSPDWSANPEAVPYSKLDDPQTLNLYGYVRNNPMSSVDTDGHEIIYASDLKNAQLVKDSVKAILSDPHTSANLSGYVGPNSPNLTIQSGDLSAGDTRTVNPDGSVTTTTVQGNTAPDIQTSTITSNGVTSAPETTLTGATITIDNRTSKGDTPGVMVHESVHAGEAQANPAKFAADAKAEKANPNHDQRPQEQRANAAQKAYTPEIKKEVKKIEKERKESH